MYVLNQVRKLLGTTHFQTHRRIFSKVSSLLLCCILYTYLANSSLLMERYREVDYMCCTHNAASPSANWIESPTLVLTATEFPLPTSALFCCCYEFVYLWRNHHDTWLPHFASSRRASTGDSSHWHIGSHLLQPQCCIDLSQPNGESITPLSAQEQYNFPVRPGSLLYCCYEFSVICGVITTPHMSL